MIEENIIELREILKADKENWHSLINSYLEKTDINLAIESIIFVKSKLSDANPAYQKRMLSLIENIKNHIRQNLKPEVEPILKDTIDLQNRIKNLESEVEERREILKELIGVSNVYNNESVFVKVGKPYNYVRITDPQIIPEEFKTPVPDKKLILKHILNGDSIKGVELAQTKSTLIIKKKTESKEAENNQ